MEKEELIKQAQELAEEEYHKAMRKINCDNPDYKRAWVKYANNDEGKEVYGLKGTPDKAFVVVEKDGTVTARRGDLSIIKKFK